MAAVMHEGGSIYHKPIGRHPTARKSATKKRAPLYSAKSSGFSTQPARRRSSGGGGGSGGGGSVGSTSSGSMRMLAASEPAPPPPPPSLAEFLGDDSTYQSQLSALKRALGDYENQMGKNKDRYDTNYQGMRRDLGTEQTGATEDLENDFASRGMYISGVQGKARGDLDQRYSRRFGDLATDRSNYFGGLNDDFLNFEREQDLTKTNARADAVSRRASRYSL